MAVKQSLLTERQAEAWIEELAPFDKWNERHLMALFSLFGIPRVMLDVGSGTGAMVNLAHKMGVEAYGVDQLERPHDWLYSHMLNQPFALSAYGILSDCDMVLSIEVAEHIAPEYHDNFCNTIRRHMAGYGWLIFSSAIPGQDGTGHIGTRPPTYWREKFASRGLNYRVDYTAMLSLLWSNIRSPLVWLPANVQVFQR